MKSKKRAGLEFEVLAEGEGMLGGYVAVATEKHGAEQARRTKDAGEIGAG